MSSIYSNLPCIGISPNYFKVRLRHQWATSNVRLEYVYTQHDSVSFTPSAPSLLLSKWTYIRLTLCCAVCVRSLIKCILFCFTFVLNTNMTVDQYKCDDVSFTLFDVSIQLSRCWIPIQKLSSHKQLNRRIFINCKLHSSGKCVSECLVHNRRLNWAHLKLKFL